MVTALYTKNESDSFTEAKDNGGLQSSHHLASRGNDVLNAGSAFPSNNEIISSAHRHGFVTGLSFNTWDKSHCPFRHFKVLSSS